MAKSKQKTRLIPTTRAANALGVSAAWVRIITKRGGIVDPQRDSYGRALFTAEDIEDLRKYRDEQRAKYPVRYREVEA